jgi:hypothetical protein
MANVECRMSNEGILSILIMMERSDTTIRHSPFFIRHSGLLR